MIMVESHKHRSEKHVNDSMRGEPMIINYIMMNDGKVTPGDISREIGTTTARIAAVLNSLEKKELIVRTIDPSDRRRILIQMTEKGKVYAKELHRGIFKKLTEMMAFLGEDDAKELIRIMKKLYVWHESQDETNCN